MMRSTRNAADAIQHAKGGVASFEPQNKRIVGARGCGGSAGGDGATRASLSTSAVGVIGKAS